MTEPARRRAAVTKASKKKAAAAAKTNIVTKEKETALAAKTAKDTGITASTQGAKAAAAIRRKKSKNWFSQNHEID